MVMTLPALEGLKECFPDSRLSILARPWVASLFEAHPAVDEVIVIKGEIGPLSNIREILKTSSIIRRKRFDMVILFQNAFEAALIAFLAGIKIRIGYNTDHRSFLLSHPVPLNFNLQNDHQTGYYLDLLKGFGCNPEKREPRLFVKAEDMLRAKEILQQEKIDDSDTILGLSPGAIFGPAKRWPAERFAQTADRAVENWNAKVVIFGSSKEKDICEEMLNRMNHPAVNMCGKTGLREAIALIKNCDFFLTNDSGLMHVAGALEVPLVAIFGSTNPKATGPAGKSSIVIKHDIKCSPCLKPVCPKDFRCMLEIGVDEVWECLEKLKKGKTNG